MPLPVASLQDNYLPQGLGAHLPLPRADPAPFRTTYRRYGLAGQQLHGDPRWFRLDYRPGKLAVVHLTLTGGCFAVPCELHSQEPLDRPDCCVLKQLK